MSRRVASGRRRADPPAAIHVNRRPNPTSACVITAVMALASTSGTVNAAYARSAPRVTIATTTTAPPAVAMCRTTGAGHGVRFASWTVSVAAPTNWTGTGTGPT